MVYSPAPLARQRAKPANWNAEPFLVAPEWQWAWRGLRNGYALWESQGRPYNLVTQTQLNAGAVGVPVWVPTPDGVAPDVFSGSTDRGWDFPFRDVEWLNGTPAYTVAMVLDTDHRTGLWWAFRIIRANGQNQFQFFADPSNSRVRHRADIAGAARLVDDTYSPYQNSRVVLVLRYNGAAVTLWRDGTQRASTAATGVLNTVAESGSISISLGYNGETNDRAWDGRIPVFYMWNRALSDQEIRLLTQDPFGPFRPNWDYLTADGQNINVGQATEVETATPFTIDRQVAVGQVTERELANPITPLISRQVVLGQATETELARSIAALVAGQDIPLGQAVERELARSITPTILGITIGEITCTVIQPAATCAILSPSAKCEVTNV